MFNNLMKSTFLVGAMFMTCVTTNAQTRIKAAFVSGSTTVKEEGAAMVADGLKYTKWCIDDKRQMPYTVVLDAQSAVSLSQYGLVTGDDTFYYPTRNPLKWKLYGSNNATSWTLIYDMKRDRRMSDENEQEYVYKLNDSKQFRYYKMEFLEMVDGTRLQLSEISLYK